MKTITVVESERSNESVARITLERTKMVGAFLANALSHSGLNINLDINVISPEVTNDLLVLRDNLAPYVQGRDWANRTRMRARRLRR